MSEVSEIVSEEQAPVGIEIKRIKHLRDDGTYEVTMALTENQTYFLLTMIINILIGQGVAAYKDVDASETTEAAVQADFLKSLDPKDLPQS